MISPLLPARLTYILGIINLIFLGLIFFSCRCLAGPKITQFLFKYPWYQKYYANHCVWWKFFFVSVLLHSLLAIISFGFPF